VFRVLGSSLRGQGLGLRAQTLLQVSLPVYYKVLNLRVRISNMVEFVL
jgi:hypothetical protein